jgi:succinyl-CoA synthetase alpha subunit
MGHAGAIISGSSGTAQEKFRVLEEEGIRVIKNASHIGQTLKSLLKS